MKPIENAHSGPGGFLRTSPVAVIDQKGIIAFDTARAADQHVVGAGDASARQIVAGKRPKPPFHAVAHDGVADLLRHCDAESLVLAAVTTRTHLEDETGHGDSPAAIGREEIRPFAKDD